MPTIKIKHIFRKNYYEKALWKEQKLICGVDEVGRGCLAGPVVTAAVILPMNKAHSSLKDSKVMKPADLLKSYAWITQNCWYATGIVSPHHIDQMNIYQATLVAMRRAVTQVLLSCPQIPSAILVDAMPLKLQGMLGQLLEIMHFTQGETKSSSIAAASIVAKVTRDSIMKRLNTSFPGYLLGQHKGYATKDHREALQEQGHSIIHRVSYLKGVLNNESDQSNQQQTLC